MTQTELVREKRRKRVASGLCGVCGNQLDREGWYCTKCLEKDKKAKKEERDFYKKIGICHICRKNKLFGSERACPECAAKQYSYNVNQDKDKAREYQRAYSSRRKELRQMYLDNGICPNCRKRKIEFGKKKCKPCLLKDAEIHRNKHIPVRAPAIANGFCYQCLKEKATNGKLCEKCYAEACKNLEKGRDSNEYYKRIRKVRRL